VIGAVARLLSARAIVTGALVIVLGAFLSSCSGQSSGALEHQACVEVAKSLKLFNSAASSAAPDAARNKALAELRVALSPAAIAAAESSDYQALAATLSESSRVPESDLVQALSAQCAAPLAGQG
jgi:hypothetical protein